MLHVEVYHLNMWTWSLQRPVTGMQFRATGGGREGEHVLVYPLKGAPTWLSRSGRRIPLKGSLTWCMDFVRRCALRTPGIIQVGRHFTRGLSSTNLVHNLVKAGVRTPKEHKKEEKKPVTKNAADNFNHYKEKKLVHKHRAKDPYDTLFYCIPPTRNGKQATMAPPSSNSNKQQREPSDIPPPYQQTYG